MVRYKYWIENERKTFESPSESLESYFEKIWLLGSKIQRNESWIKTEERPHLSEIKLALSLSASFLTEPMKSLGFIVYYLVLLQYSVQCQHKQKACVHVWYLIGVGPECGNSQFSLHPAFSDSIRGVPYRVALGASVHLQAVRSDTVSEKEQHERLKAKLNHFCLKTEEKGNLKTVLIT